MEALVRQLQRQLIVSSNSFRSFSTTNVCEYTGYRINSYRAPYLHAAHPSVGQHKPRQFPIHKLTRMRCVDNSAIGKQAMAEGKPPKVIHIYRKVGKYVKGDLGDVVLMTIKGEMKKGVIVGTKRHQKPFVPKMDTNNVVLIDDGGTPLGTRIHVPIPMVLRTILKTKTFAKGPDYTKLLAIAPRFV